MKQAHLLGIIRLSRLLSLPTFGFHSPWIPCISELESKNSFAFSHAIYSKKFPSQVKITTLKQKCWQCCHQHIKAGSHELKLQASFGERTTGWKATPLSHVVQQVTEVTPHSWLQCQGSKSDEKPTCAIFFLPILYFSFSKPMITSMKIVIPQKVSVSTC